MDSDLPKYCFFRSQRFLANIAGKNDIFKTEPTDEDPKVSSVEFISASMVPPGPAKVLVKTPDWLCKKYKIDQEDTFTRIVDDVPDTADRGNLSTWETLVRAIIDSETAKMLKSMGMPEMTAEEFEKEKHSVRKFLTGGPNPSTEAAILKERFLKRHRRSEERKIEREIERKTMKRRIMTRKTAEREKRKSEAIESPPAKQIWVKIRR